MFPPLRLVALALVLLLVVNIIFQYERLSEHDGGWDTEPRLSNWRDWAWGSLLAPYRLEPEESLPLDWMPPDPTRIPNGRGKTVCFVTAEFEGHAPLGGIGTAFTDLARILAGRGWNVTILIALPLQEVGTSAWIHTLNIVHLDVVPRVWISPNTVSISRGMQVALARKWPPRLADDVKIFWLMLSGARILARESVRYRPFSRLLGHRLLLAVGEAAGLGVSGYDLRGRPARALLLGEPPLEALSRICACCFLSSLRLVTMFS